MKVSPRDYARNNREWRGAVPLDTFDRLSREINSDCNAVDVHLKFSLNENGHVRMQGSAALDASIPCHRCTESMSTTVCADVDALIVRNDVLAQALVHETDVMVIEDNPVDVAVLLEDDLLMSIPWRVCDEGEECPNLVTKTQAVDIAGNDKQRPFANLRTLLDQ